MSKSLYARIVAILSWLAVAGLWIYVISVMDELPERIPIHFNFENEPDNWGGKGSMWALAIIPTILLGLFEVIKRYPDHLNYPVAITEANKARQQQLGLGLLSTIGLVLPIIFGYIVYSTVGYVRHETFEASIPLILALVFGPIGIYFYLALKAK